MEDGSGGGLGTPAGCNSTCSLCACPASLQCLICLKRGIRPAPSFCGVACYREHWASHRNHHHEAAAAAAANSYGAASASSEISTKSSSSSSLSVGTNSSACSPVPCSMAGTNSPLSVVSQSPMRMGPNPVTSVQHRRQRSQAMQRVMGSSGVAPAPQREGGNGQSWTQHWPGPGGSCHQPLPPHPWYEHGAWTPSGGPGMHHMHRNMVQEQMVGPGGNWGYPSRWSPPYYWGGSF